MDYCYKKIPFNFGIGPTPNGLMAAILDFHYADTYVNISKTFF